MIETPPWHWGQAVECRCKAGREGVDRVGQFRRRRLEAIRMVLDRLRRMRRARAIHQGVARHVE